MPKPNARLILEPIDAPADPEAAIRAILAADRPAILDSSAAHPQYGRYCILACDPAETLLCPGQAGTDPFRALSDAVHDTPRIGSSECPGQSTPFVGGWIGLLSYEAGRWLERLPARTGHHRFLPTACFSLYDTAVVYDRLRNEWMILAVEWPADCRLSSRPPVGKRLRDIQHTLRQSVTEERQSLPQEITETRADRTREQYEAVVRRVIEYIAAGDVFQVNLAQRFVVPTREHPAEVFLRLRRHNPSCFGAYLALPAAVVVSASPELFVSLRGQDVITRPIKGTRPRSADPARDAALRQALWESSKDRAELAMIIDLERNDLGRVCEYGSIRVLEAAVAEEHPTVHHLVGTIIGRLRDGLDAIDLLRATFPGGSITGAPKIRAMEIIDELEPVPRGVYCGSIGCIGLDGSATFNIAIRTAAFAAGEAEVYAGGGIVADSVPSDEYDETLAKAAALLDALGARLDERERIGHAVPDEYPTYQGERG